MDAGAQITIQRGEEGLVELHSPESYGEKLLIGRAGDNVELRSATGTRYEFIQGESFGTTRSVAKEIKVTFPDGTVQTFSGQSTVPTEPANPHFLSLEEQRIADLAYH